MQGNGLIHETDSGGYHIANQYTTTNTPHQARTAQATQPANGGVSMDTQVSATGAATGVNSHLDSWFDTHALTREDVLVVAAALQIGLWIALLYLEVTDA